MTWLRRRVDGGHLLVAVALLPFVAAAVALLVDVGGSYLAAEDIALTELRTADVGHHPVLIGPYSRDGWNHPGPALFYLLAVPYRLVGSRAIGLGIGALLINAAALIGIAVVARRRGGLPLLLVTLVGLATVVHGFGPRFWADPWNPYVVVLPFALVLFLVWEMACGQSWALPVGAVVATFCTQTHVGYAPLTLPLVAAGAVALVVQARLPEQRRGLWRAAAWTLVGLAVLWLPPVAQQLQAGPGNLRKVIRYFGRGEESHSVVEGVRAVVSQLAAVPEWVSGDRSFDRFTGEPFFLGHTPFPLLLAPLVVVVALLVRRRHGPALRLAAVVGGAMVLGAASVARTTGPAFDYRLRWNSLVAMVALVLMVWGMWLLLPDGVRGRLSRPGAMAAVGLVVLLSATSAVNAARAGVPHAERSEVTHALEGPVLRSLPTGTGPILVDAVDPGGAVYQPALVRRLERRGVDARVPIEGRDSYGAHRVLRDGEHPRARLVIAGDTFDEVRRGSGLPLVAYWGTLDPEARARHVARLARLRHGGDDLALLGETRLLGTGTAVGVFLDEGG
jgi:hypothetical protein